MSDCGSTSTQKCTAPRNTISGVRVRSWVFTWNNYTEEDCKAIKKWLAENCDKADVQPEIGENGTPHLQGWFHLKDAKTFEAIHKKWPKIHLEVCKNINAAKNYCRKEKTRAGEGFTIDDSELTAPAVDLMEDKIPKPWQQEILDLIKTKPDERTIYWYWEETGCCGKTTLARSICIQNRKTAIYLSGKANDIKAGVASHIHKHGESSLKIAIFAFTRSIEHFVSYEALESIKDGIFYSGKYESDMVIFNLPHVICFANFPPDTNKLSKDRWVIKKINGDRADNNSNDAAQYI